MHARGASEASSYQLNYFKQQSISLPEKNRVDIILSPAFCIGNHILLLIFKEGKIEI